MYVFCKKYCYKILFFSLCFSFAKHKSKLRLIPNKCCLCETIVVPANSAGIPAENWIEVACLLSDSNGRE